MEWLNKIKGWFKKDEISEETPVVEDSNLDYCELCGKAVTNIRTLKMQGKVIQLCRSCKRKIKKGYIKKWDILK